MLQGHLASKQGWHTVTCITLAACLCPPCVPLDHAMQLPNVGCHGICYRLQRLFYTLVSHNALANIRLQWNCYGDYLWMMV